MKLGRRIISTPPDIEGWEDTEQPGIDAETRSFAVQASLHGERLDRALACLVPEFSRSYLQQLIELGAVTLQGQPASRSAYRVKAGDAVAVELRPTPQSRAFVPQPMSLQVVYEDADLLVIDKPAGLVVHPAPGHWSGTLLNGLLARDAQAASLPRAGIVHRLDKDTSGLMLVARSRACMDRLVTMIAEREVTRLYVALAHRRWEGPALRHVDAPIGRDPVNRLRMAVVDPQRHPCKPAATTLRFLSNAAHGCCVQARLHTGRTHQIRVHMAHIGHPLLSDALYGGAMEPGLERQALHAHRLVLRHPMTGAALSFAAPLPTDLDAAIRCWGLSYNEIDRLTSPSILAAS